MSTPHRRRDRSRPVTQAPGPETHGKITDWIAAISAAMAVPISIAAILVSWHATDLAEREELEISSYTYDANAVAKIIPPVTSPKGDVEMPSFLPLYWHCIVSNTGDKTSSILFYEIVQIGPKPHGEIIYSTTDEGIYSSDEKSIRLPISIAAGAATDIVVKIGVPLDSRAYAAIAGDALIHLNPTVRQLNDDFAVHGFDLFGNPVKATLNNGRIAEVAWQIRDLEGPRFILTFKISRGSFSRVLSPLADRPRDE